MNGQMPLDFDPRSDTSRLASIYAMPNKTRDRDRALRALIAAGERGLTDFELADAVSADGGPATRQTSIGCRRKTLVDDGFVARRLVIDPATLTLVPDKRPAPSGAMSAVWVLATYSRPTPREA